MQAISGPLQSRLTTLDLDFSRANRLPDDYDTDLESPWSNLSESSFPPRARTPSRSSVTLSSRSLRPGPRLLLEHHPERSQCILSKTDGTATHHSDERDDGTSHSSSQSASQSGPAAAHEHLVDLRVDGDRLHQLTRQQNYPTDEQCTHSSTCDSARSVEQSDHFTASPSLLSLTLTLSLSLSSR